MRTRCNFGTVVASGILAAGIVFFLSGNVFAHCDTTGGPIIPEARAALEKGDVTPVLKWVRQGDEAEIKAAFAKAVAVRAKGAEAKELADQFFLETLVRLHRAGEGAPYTGIRNEPVEAIAAMADKALAEGSADGMIQSIGEHLAAAVKVKFSKALEARKSKDKSVEAGREFVKSYVTYVHYVEGIHTAIMATGGHHEHAADAHEGHAADRE